jgi:hypothetical protein
LVKGKRFRPITARHFGQNLIVTMGNTSTKHFEDEEENSDDEEEDILDAALQSTWQPSNYGVSASDRRGLMKFYRAAGGDKWRTRTNWLKASPLGMWYGITVSSRNGQKMVTDISLHHNRLRGEIYVATFFCSCVALSLSLTSFCVKISGEFNKSAIEFSKIVHLEVLNLGHNRLRGTIPVELAMAERLKELILNDNALTGPIPEFLAKMPK